MDVDETTQLKTLRVIAGLTAELGHSPSIAQLAAARDLSGTATMKHVKQLEAAGLLAPRPPRAARCLSVTSLGKQQLRKAAR